MALPDPMSKSGSAEADADARNTGSEGSQAHPGIVLTEIRQDQIQEACLLAIKLTEKAQQAHSREDGALMETRLNELIQTQQDLENALARLQGSQDLTYLWWQVAELETLVYGLHKALHPAV
ncbi:MAG: hypothetical protein ACAI44_35850 [Candidatus Sericytochromatia bacterium]